jgi:hypothetical protein
MAGTVEELRDENARLRSELSRLTTRVQAFEASRWFRLHPRLLWRRGVGRVTERTASGSSTRADLVLPEPDAHVARFRATVLPRGTFTQTWFLGDVPRWKTILDELEGTAARVLEIGSFEGLGACYLLWRLPDATITCVDTFAGSAEHRGTDIVVSELESRFDANIALVDATRVRKIVGDSRRELLDLLALEERFDLVYVDGSHLALDVMVDAVLSWQLLRSGGTLVFDDYGWTELGDDALLGPRAAIDAFLALVHGKYETRFHEYQVAIRKIG